MDVAEQLDLDVARPLDVALDEDGAVAERGLGLAARRGARVVELVGAADDAHAAPAAARRRLHEQRKAELVRLAGLDDGDAGLARDLLRAELVAAVSSASGVGPTQMSPAASTARAKSALSARKP